MKLFVVICLVILGVSYGEGRRTCHRGKTSSAKTSSGKIGVLISNKRKICFISMKEKFESAVGSKSIFHLNCFYFI